MARKLTVRLWDILAEQESDVLAYFNSINDKNNSAIKSIVDEVNQINIDMESKVTDVNYVHTDNNYTTVEKQKLQGIADNANNYVHPSTHNASMITQDASHRFATDTEKATWNGKANIGDIPNVSNKLEISNIIAGTNITLDKVGNNVTINSTASGGGDYILPTASATVKGGIKVGSGLTMTGDVLSATGGGGSVDLTQVSTNIVPTTNSTLNLGSPTNRFKTLYCDEAKLATNTLYIGDVPVLGTDNGNIMVKADPNQNLGVKTTGMGNLGIHSSNITEMLSDGVGGSVNVKAMGTNGTVNITSATGRIEMTAPTINMSGNTTTGNLTIGGNLTVQGTTTTVDSANLSVADNIIELNKGETGQGVSKLQAGIKIKRGDLQDQHIVFDEASDRWKVGEGTSLKNITTDDMIPTKVSQLTNDSGYLTTLPTHNHSDLYYSKAEIDGKIPVIDVNKQYVDAQDTLLDGKITENTNKIGDLHVSVNEQGSKISNLENNTSFINQSMLGTNRSCYKYLGSRNTNGITSNKKWKISLPKNKSINFSVILQASWTNADATGILKKTFSYGDMGTWQSIKESEYELIQGNIQTEFSISDIIAENNECFILISSVVNVSNNQIYVTIHSDTENKSVIDLITLSECYGTDARVIPQPRYKYSEKTEIFCTANTGFSIVSQKCNLINNVAYINILVRKNSGNFTNGVMENVAKLPNGIVPLYTTLGSGIGDITSSTSKASVILSLSSDGTLNVIPLASNVELIRCSGVIVL